VPSAPADPSRFTVGEAWRVGERLRSVKPVLA
jgi:hypothetical protein